MRKIENWGNIKESTGFQRLPAGGYIVKILNATDFPDKEYLKISFDIAEGDHKGFFGEQFKNDTREGKKWPNAGTFIRSYKHSAEAMFKGFANALENSNKGYKFDFDESKLKNKLVGVIIADEEYQNQKGQVRTRTYVSSVRSIDTIKKGEFTVPELKKLDATKATTVKPQEAFVNPFGDDNPASDPFASAPVEDNTNPWGDDDNGLPF